MRNTGKHFCDCPLCKPYKPWPGTENREYAPMTPLEAALRASRVHRVHWRFLRVGWPMGSPLGVPMNLPPSFDNFLERMTSTIIRVCAVIVAIDDACVTVAQAVKGSK